MKLNNSSSNILYPCDKESLILSHFVRSLLLGMREFTSPRPYFEQLGIELPASIESWNDFDIDLLLNCEGCIISSNQPLTMFENLTKPIIKYEDN